MNENSLVNPADDLTVFIPRIPKVAPRPEPLLPRWVGQLVWGVVFAALGAVAAGMLILTVLILTA